MKMIKVTISDTLMGRTSVRRCKDGEELKKKTEGKIIWWIVDEDSGKMIWHNSILDTLGKMKVRSDV